MSDWEPADDTVELMAAGMGRLLAAVVPLSTARAALVVMHEQMEIEHQQRLDKLVHLSIDDVMAGDADGYRRNFLDEGFDDYRIRIDDVARIKFTERAANPPTPAEGAPSWLSTAASRSTSTGGETTAPSRGAGPADPAEPAVKPQPTQKRSARLNPIGDDTIRLQRSLRRPKLRGSTPIGTPGRVCASSSPPMLDTVTMSPPWENELHVTPYPAPPRPTWWKPQTWTLM